MRKIRQGQVRMFIPENFRGTPRDPLGAREAGHRSPESVEREWAQSTLQLFSQSFGCAGDAEDLVAVRGIIRFGRDTDIDGGSLIEPPKQLGASERPTPCRALATGGLIE